MSFQVQDWIPALSTDGNWYWIPAYYVQPGDTMEEICQAFYGTTDTEAIEEILVLNANIPGSANYNAADPCDPNEIQAYAYLALPTTVSLTGCSSEALFNCATVNPNAQGYPNLCYSGGTAYFDCISCSFTIGDTCGMGFANPC
jgi:phage tail protein X